MRDLLSRNPAGQFFADFLAEVSAWPKVGVHGIKPKGSSEGSPLDYSRYLRIRKAGSQLGGFVYAYPVDGTVNFRLNYATDAGPAPGRTCGMAIDHGAP